MKQFSRTRKRTKTPRWRMAAAIASVTLLALFYFLDTFGTRTKEIPALLSPATEEVFPEPKPTAQRIVTPETTTSFSPSVQAAEKTPLSTEDPEKLLLSLLEDIRKNRLSSALKKTSHMTDAYPNFRLGQMIHADLLLAQVSPLAQVGGDSEHLAQMAPLIAEMKSRWQFYQNASQHPPAGYLPETIISLGSKTRYIFIAALSQSRLYLFENRSGTPYLIETFYITIGKDGILKKREGDKRTPIGVYNMTDRISDRKLSDLYGDAALPISYPNEWDRRLGRTGSGIWLHGNPKDNYSRPPQDSDGCITLSNDNLSRILSIIEGTHSPIILQETVHWISPESWKTRQPLFLAMVEAWKKDWEQTDTDRYVSHYSKEFLTHKGQRQPFNRWKESGKPNKIEMQDLNLFLYPGEENLVVSDFLQDYDNNTYHTVNRKRQYWKQEADNHWRILVEDTIR